MSGAGLEMATPILEFFVRIGERTDLQSLSGCVETLLEGLEVLVEINQDAKDLSKCYGIETHKIAACSNKSKLIAERIFG